MLQRVSDTEKMNALEEVSTSKRESISKSAVSSFSDVIVQKSKNLKSKGQPLDKIAKSFNISENVLKEMIDSFDMKNSETPKCECMNKEASAQEDDKTDPAKEAYEALHNRSLDKTNFTQSKDARVLSGGHVKDNGGYHKQIGTDSKPTIFNPEKLAEMIEKSDNGERIKKENAHIEERREISKRKYETIDGKDLKEALAKTIQDKSAGVASIHGRESHQYSKKMPINAISIFDEKEFERVSKTAGEASSEMKKQQSQKKDQKSLLNNGKIVSTKDIAQEMINSMLK